MPTQSKAVTITLPSDREIAITRSFKASRELVFDAWTKCEHLKHWWGPSTWTLPVCEIDLRPGGRWRYVMRTVDGSAEMAMHGVYLEIDHPGRLVSTEQFEGDEFENMGGGTTNTIALSEQGGVTTLVVTTLYASRESRDRVLGSGFDAGLEDAFQRLDGVLERQVAGAE